MFECPICLETLDPKEGRVLNCMHQICKACAEIQFNYTYSKLENVPLQWNWNTNEAELDTVKLVAKCPLCRHQSLAFVSPQIEQSVQQITTRKLMLVEFKRRILILINRVQTQSRQRTILFDQIKKAILEIQNKYSIDKKIIERTPFNIKGLDSLNQWVWKNRMKEYHDSDQPLVIEYIKLMVAVESQQQ